MLDAALKRGGIVQLPDYYLQPHLNSGQLIALLTQYQQPDQGIWAIYPHNRHPSPKESFMLDDLIQVLVARPMPDSQYRVISQAGKTT